MEILPNQIITLVNSVYNDRDRHYHNMKHIDNMLEEFQFLIDAHPDVVDKLKHYREFRIAILFHDIINGEEQDTSKSAWIMSKLLENQNLDLEYIDKLIMATTHDNRQLKTFDEQLIHDLDLLVLSSSSEKYIEYVNSIRKEYNEISDNLYIEKRKEILNNFLSNKIYLMEYYSIMEDTAKANIQYELDNIDNWNNLYLYNTFLIELKGTLTHVYIPARVDSKESYSALVSIIADKDHIRQVTDSDTFSLMYEGLNNYHSNVGAVFLIPVDIYKEFYEKTMKGNSIFNIVQWR